MSKGKCVCGHERAAHVYDAQAMRPYCTLCAGRANALHTYIEANSA